MARFVPRLRAALLFIPVLVAAGCAHGSGPLGVDGGGSSTGGQVAVGQYLVVPVVLPANKGAKDAILESLEPADPVSARGLELRYAAVRLPDSLCGGSTRGWPPRPCPAGRLHPVAGFRYRAGARAEILVGARSIRPGRWSVPAFRLRYSVGGSHYSAVYAQGVAIHSDPTFAFQTPRRDVVCEADERERSLQCQLSAGAIEPHPATCYGEKLVGYWLEHAGRAGIMCGRRDLIRPRTVLRSALRRSGFACTLRAAGVRCSNRSGHGFFVSNRRSYRF